MNVPQLRQQARALFDAAVTGADPAHRLGGMLPAAPATGRLFVLAAGKAAVSMIEAAETHYLDALAMDPARITGLAVTRHGYGGPTRAIPVIEAGHPVPDLLGMDATKHMLTLAETAGPDDLAVFLVSGGGSANLIAPAGAITLAEKQALTTDLLRSGAPIDEMNCLRKHISRVKGGRLARALAPATIATFAISDVPGDDPSVIASGPTVPDQTSLADAQAILAKYRLSPTVSISAALADPANESPKPGDPVFDRASFTIVSRPSDAVAAAVREATAMGYRIIDLGPDVAGEARDVAQRHAAHALDARQRRERVAIISGGELTVTIRGNGRGGPNQEYALALAVSLAGAPGIVALACDTDGTDGGQGLASDPAGALVDPCTLAKARANGLDAAGHLADNNSTNFFASIGDLVITGPTRTNANDIRVILVDPDATD